MSHDIVDGALLSKFRDDVSGSAELQDGLSYATAGNYCDGYDCLPALVTRACDLKDVQRFWMLKTILATQKPGSTLLEIGAGEPIVADLLGRLGYRVVVVDPYQGAGNGPTELDAFRTAYREVEIVADLFSCRLEAIEPGSVDCCYSISVIEHVSHEAQHDIVAGIKKFTKSGGSTIHCIDCVVGGPGTDFHREMLTMFATRLQFDGRQVDAMISAANEDPETYFLSVEAHNRWRGSVPYDDFPMRRVLSAHVSRTVIGYS